jgi:hypothetical protein
MKKKICLIQESRGFALCFWLQHRVAQAITERTQRDESYTETGYKINIKNYQPPRRELAFSSPPAPPPRSQHTHIKLPAFCLRFIFICPPPCLISRHGKKKHPPNMMINAMNLSESL